MKNFKYSSHKNSKQSQKMANFICTNYEKYTQRELATRCKVHSNVIKKILKLNKLKGNSIKNKPKCTDINKINAIFQDHIENRLTLLELAKKYKLGKYALAASFKRQGLKMKNYGQKKCLDIDRFKDLLLDFKKGVLQKDLSKKYNLSPESVRKILKHNNLKRSKSEACFLKNEKKPRKKYINKRGYVTIGVPIKDRHLVGDLSRTSGILEHRFIMSQHLNRPLEKHENVHHINGIKTDNRIENLELWSTSQVAGQRIKDKVKWAEQILKLYKKDIKLGKI